MADINIERKEGRNIWPMVIIGLVLLALLAWWLTQRGGADRIVQETGIGSDTATAERRVEGAPREVNNFIAFVDDNRARAEASLDHNYTRDGLHRLADALDAMRRDSDQRGTAQTGATGQTGQTGQTQAGQATAVNLEQQISRIRALGDSLQREEQSVRHANHARTAFTLAASTMETLQQRHYPAASSQVQQVRQAAENINVQTPFLQQKQHVQTFFDRSATALRAMAG